MISDIDKNLVLKYLFIVFVVIFIIVAAVAVFILDDKSEPVKMTEVCFKKTSSTEIAVSCFKAELAITPSERERGLMFRESLDAGSAMLFVFESEGVYPFWMKNTFVHLDIIWMSKDKEIVFIAENVQPCPPAGELCPSINPGKNAGYVLEINAGLAEKIGLIPGDKAEFQ